MAFPRWRLCSHSSNTCFRGFTRVQMPKYISIGSAVFVRPFVKRFAICYQTVVCLSCHVCDVGVLWKNGWMDQDETWHAGRGVRLGPGHIVLDGNSAPPSPKGQSQFSAHICCCEMAGWIKMPRGTEVGLDPSNIVLDEDPAPGPHKRGISPIFGPCLLSPKGWMDQNAT